MEIPLTQGRTATIDPEDWPLVSPFTWFASEDKNTWYATAHGPDGTLRMHRVIMGAEPGETIDHRDGDGLMNRRFNLRRATVSQNGQNQRIGEKNKSGFKGVSWAAHAGKWRTNIKVDGKHVHLGYFSDLHAAARAYNEAAKNCYGEFACLNVLPVAA